MITVVSVSMAVQLVCISFFFKAQEHWECLSRKAPELRCMRALGGLLGPSFTGWSGHSGVWACRATRRGLAGKTPPTGSSQWTVCDHHPDCRIAPLHHPPTVKYAHIQTQDIGDLLWRDAEEIWEVVLGRPMKRTHWHPNSGLYSQVRSESVWFSACGTVTVQMS